MTETAEACRLQDHLEVGDDDSERRHREMDAAAVKRAAAAGQDHFRRAGAAAGSRADAARAGQRAKIFSRCQSRYLRSGSCALRGSSSASRSGGRP